MMHSVTTTVLIASVVAHEMLAASDKVVARESMDKFVDKLIDTALNLRLLNSADLDNMMLSKGLPGHLNTPRINHRLALPAHGSVSPVPRLGWPMHYSARSAWHSGQESRSSWGLRAVDKGTNILEINNLISQGLLVQTAREGYKLIWKRLITELAPQSSNGTYVRPSYSFQGWIGKGEFPIESGRYHIYLGNPCPWCHRVALARSLNGLEQIISLSYMEDNPIKASRGGWSFGPGNKKDPVFGARDLKKVYDLLTGGSFQGRCTAPLLIDKKLKKIVSNESKDIVRMLSTVNFQEKPSKITLYPEEMAAQIEKLNSWVYEEINNGVYKAGFSTDQKAYEDSVDRVFKGLDECEQILKKSKFLNGEFVTESDVFLLPTIVRFDAVYNILFRCSLKKICEYPGIFRWLEDMQRIPGVRRTFDLEDARRSYFEQLFPLNPSRIVPKTAANIGLDVNEDAEFASKVLSSGSEDRITT